MVDVQEAGGSSDGPSLAAKVAWLSDPSSYPDRPASIDRIETHFAWVFLTPDRAYKLKKPQKVYGADLRTVAARERCCREEMRLNSRLAAQTYLRAVPLTVAPGGFAIDGDGPVADWLVEMRRLGRARMLDVSLAAGTVGAADLDRVVECLLTLEAPAPAPARLPGAAEEGVAAVARRLEEALSEVARPEFAIDPLVLERAEGVLRGLWADVRPLLLARTDRVREGHGDVRAEHVWLGPPVQIIDALEFERALRMLDPAEDVAMLAIDTERLGGGWTREVLCRSYEQRARDPLPPRLWDFYLALRAATRAKVALWHLDDPAHATDPARWRRAALEWLELCTRYGLAHRGAAARPA